MYIIYIMRHFKCYVFVGYSPYCHEQIDHNICNGSAIIILSRCCKSRSLLVAVSLIQHIRSPQLLMPLGASYFVRLRQNYGERDRIRTCDPVIKSHLLYQLSYAPVSKVFIQIYDSYNVTQ